MDPCIVCTIVSIAQAQSRVMAFRSCSTKTSLISFAACIHLVVPHSRAGFLHHTHTHTIIVARSAAPTACLPPHTMTLTIRGNPIQSKVTIVPNQSRLIKRTPVDSPEPTYQSAHPSCQITRHQQTTPVTHMILLTSSTP